MNNFFTIPPVWFLVIAAILFAIGMIGVLFRKNVLICLMSIELMLNAANLTLVAFSKLHASWQGTDAMRGQAFALLGIAIAAAEAAVGLAIVVGVFRNRQSINLHDLTQLKY